MTDRADRLRELVSDVAAAYFSNTHVSPAEITDVLQRIASTLGAIGGGEGEQPGLASAPAQPATLPTPQQIAASVAPDGLTSFEDGRVYKTLRRHLTSRGLTPAQYRQKWGLPADYPMVAPKLSAMRSEMARQTRLGRGPAERAPAPVPAKALRSHPRRKTREKAALR
jgi:predicted transcriptional regulator